MCEPTCLVSIFNSAVHFQKFALDSVPRLGGNQARDNGNREGQKGMLGYWIGYWTEPS